MSAMLRWSPTRQFHFHQGSDEPLDSSIGRTASAANQTERQPWLPAAEGRIEDGVYIIQLSLPGVDPKDVNVSLMENVLTVKGERKADHETKGKRYFVHEVAYGTFERSFELPEGVDAAQVEAKHANGILSLKIPAPKAATPKIIDVKAA
jgi:HSP20 family protein